MLAALSVFAIAGASAGIATVATSHHSHTPGDGTPRRRPGVSSPSRPRRRSRRPPGNAAGGRRDVGRQADQPRVVQPGLADRQRGLALRGRRRFPRPDRPGHRGHPPDGPVQPAGLQPAGRRREHGVGGVVLRRRRDRPARLRRQDARPGRVGAGARHRRGVQPGPGRAGRRARRQALRGRGRHRGHRGPGRPPGDAPDLPDRGPGQLGGGLARRQQALRRGGPFRIVPAAGLRRRHRHPGVLVPDVRRRCREPGRDRRRRLGHDGHRDERVGLVRPRRRPDPLLPGQPGRGSRVQFGAGLQRRRGLGRRLTRAHLRQPGHRPGAGAHAHPHRPRRRGVLRQPHRAEQRPRLRPVPGQRGSAGRRGQPHAARGLLRPG